MKKFTTISHQEVYELICDGCGLAATVDDGYEFGEFINIEHHCGYGVRQYSRPSLDTFTLR